MTARQISDLAADYARSRDPESLGRLQDAVRQAPGYTPDLEIERVAVPLLERGAYAEVLTLVEGSMPGAFFSPTAHGLLAAAHDGLGDVDRARRETGIARLALGSILDSGDGSAERPWRVLRVSDEYDVLRSQGRVSTLQRFVTRGDRDLDHHRCTDGSEAWFDVELLAVRTRG